MRVIVGLVAVLVFVAPSAGVEGDGERGVSAELLSIAEARFGAFGDDAKHQFAEKKMTVTVVLAGPAVQAATHWGHVVLSGARDDAGTDLKLQVGYKNAGESWVSINREHMWFFNDDPPRDAIKVELEIDPSSRGADAMEVLAGSVSLKASRVQLVLVGDLGEMVGKAIDSSALERAGIGAVVQSFTPQNPDGLVKVKVDGPEGAIQAIELVDVAGKRVDNGKMWFRMGQSTTYTLSGDKKLSGDVRLKIGVETSNDVTVVPFSFEDVALP